MCLLMQPLDQCSSELCANCGKAVVTSNGQKMAKGVSHSQLDFVLITIALHYFTWPYFTLFHLPYFTLPVPYPTLCPTLLHHYFTLPYAPTLPYPFLPWAFFPTIPYPTLFWSNVPYSMLHFTSQSFRTWFMPPHHILAHTKTAILTHPTLPTLNLLHSILAHHTLFPPYLYQPQPYPPYLTLP